MILLTFQWFWLVKIGLLVPIAFCVWKLYKSEFKSKFWWVSSAIFVIFVLVNPIKMDLDTHSATNYANQQIQESKILPPKIEDNSFNDATENVIGISTDDLK